MTVRKIALSTIMVSLLCLLMTPLWSAPDKTVVKVLAYGNEANMEGITWMRLVDTFERENPDVDIQYQLLYDEAYFHRLTALLEQGGDDVPDMAYMGADIRWGAPWREAGQQFDHRPYIDSNKFDLGLIPPMGPAGEIYEIPQGTSLITTVLYMNEPLVRSLGFSIPRTYEDIKAMVPAARAAGIDAVTIDGADSWAWGVCLLSCIVARMTGDPAWVSRAVAGEYAFTDKAFVKSLAMLKTMVDDGVIDSRTVEVDYGSNLMRFSQEKALFLVQGQWATFSFDKEVQDVTLMLAWPEFPGEAGGLTGSVAAAVQVGYGLSKKGGENPRVREAALRFLYEYFHAEKEVTLRFREGFIGAPILRDYRVPEDLPPIFKRKFDLSRRVVATDVIDSFLNGAANDALNVGCQRIVRGLATPEEVAREVESLLREQQRKKGR